MRTSFQAFEEAFAAHAGNAALDFGTRRITYREFSREIERYAFLNRLGARRVGIFGQKDLCAYASLFAALKYNVTFVPLNPKLPDDRLLAILDTSGIDSVIASPIHAQRAERILSNQGRSMNLLMPFDESEEGGVRSSGTIAVYGRKALDACGPAAPRGEPEGDSPAYIIFTSGSTGRPKGVTISHEAVLSIVKNLKALLPLHSGDRVAQQSDLSFDMSLFDIFICMSQGACLCPVPDGVSFMPAHFLRDMEITVWCSVPSILGLIKKFGLFTKENFRTLRAAIFGGEPLDIILAAQVLTELDNCKLINIYGPTEATIIVSAKDLLLGDIQNPNGSFRRVTMGPVFANHRYRILDESGHESRIGELHLSGPQVFTGYCNDPGLTAETLFDEPNPDGTMTRWYRTGDIVELDENGELIFLERRDSQVKVNGNRIDLDEISHWIKTFLDCTAVETICYRENASVPQRIYSFIVGSDPDREPSLRSYLMGKLPAYMKPDDFFFLKEMPLTGNGKIDKKKLAKMIGDSGARIPNWKPQKTCEISPEKLAFLSELVGNTPIYRMSDDRLDLSMKLENRNFTGSLKVRTALQVILDGVANGEIDAETTIIESSSGNFAIAMAALCKKLALRFIAVIDPNIQKTYRNFLEATCAKVILVTEVDEMGGYQRSRIARVQFELRNNENYYWPNQYKNPSCMTAHYRHTGDEIIRQIPSLDYAFIGVSSGGTLAGLSKRLKEHYQGVRIVAVDAEGSVIFPGKPRKRFIAGLGSTSKPGLLNEAVVDEFIKVSDSEVIDGCMELWKSHGIFAGGSTGGVYSAIKKYFDRKPPADGRKPEVFFICADGGHAYLDTIYSDDWRAWFASQEAQLREKEALTDPQESGKSGTGAL